MEEVSVDSNKPKKKCLLLMSDYYHCNFDRVENNDYSSKAEYNAVETYVKTVLGFDIVDGNKTKYDKFPNDTTIFYYVPEIVSSQSLQTMHHMEFQLKLNSLSQQFKNCPVTLLIGHNNVGSVIDASSYSSYWEQKFCMGDPVNIKEVFVLNLNRKSPLKIESRIPVPVPVPGVSRKLSFDQGLESYIECLDSFIGSNNTAEVAPHSSWKFKSPQLAAICAILLTTGSGLACGILALSGIDLFSLFAGAISFALPIPALWVSVLVTVFILTFCAVLGICQLIETDRNFKQDTDELTDKKKDNSEQDMPDPLAEEKIQDNSDQDTDELTDKKKDNSEQDMPDPLAEEKIQDNSDQDTDELTDKKKDNSEQDMPDPLASEQGTPDPLAEEKIQDNSDQDTDELTKEGNSEQVSIAPDDVIRYYNK